MLAIAAVLGVLAVYAFGLGYGIGSLILALLLGVSAVVLVLTAMSRKGQQLMQQAESEPDVDQDDEK